MNYKLPYDPGFGCVLPFIFPSFIAKRVLEDENRESENKNQEKK